MACNACGDMCPHIIDMPHTVWNATQEWSDALSEPKSAALVHVLKHVISKQLSFPLNDWPAVSLQF